eukprot:2213933-Lingulodinium_polyedra.AAC.1
MRVARFRSASSSARVMPPEPSTPLSLLRRPPRASSTPCIAERAAGGVQGTASLQACSATARASRAVAASRSAAAKVSLAAATAASA